MRLHVPFLQLPLHFDAALLREEMLAVGADAWRAHPSKYEGNFSLPLIAVDGDPDSDEVAGPMSPTPYLARCPYLSRVLGKIGAVWGRTRLMKLAPGAEVTAHVDTNYYWREHIRVHVPIQTNPAVRFLCGDAEVNMQEGECWIFDTWRPHRVINGAPTERVHLVADTVGGDGFWRIADRALAPGARVPDGWSELFTPDTPAAADAPLLLERFNLPVVMSPWELREHLKFIFTYVKPNPATRAVQEAASRFAAGWHALWVRFGDTPEGWQLFASSRDNFDAWLVQNAESLQLTNGMPFVGTLRAMLLKATVTGGEYGSAATIAPSTLNPARPPTDVTRAQAAIERPIFIVCPPRSGSSLLFETLAGSPDLCTLGDESHRLIEVETAGGSLGAIARGYPSNRLDAADATPEIAAELRQRYRECVFDRDGRRRSGRVRLLEKTPKNALRIPFLFAIFPDAHFIYLYRDPRAVMASMLEAWESGRFRTYPDLPGWTGLPWSMVLVPGWRDLIGRPLPEIVAAQWAITTRTLLDDLQHLERERLHAVRHETFLADPDREIRRLCAELGLGWDRKLDAALPLARYTVTPPGVDKWRKREADILPLMHGLADLDARAAHAADEWARPG